MILVCHTKSVKPPTGLACAIESRLARESGLKNQKYTRIMAIVGLVDFYSADLGRKCKLGGRSALAMIQRGRIDQSLASDHLASFRDGTRL